MLTVNLGLEVGAPMFPKTEGQPGVWVGSYRWTHRDSLGGWAAVFLGFQMVRTQTTKGDNARARAHTQAGFTF